MLVTAITFDTLRIQGCAARNVHGFTLDEIKKMSEDWEEAPPLYLRLDIHSLFHDDNLRGHSIQEVDMDTEDAEDANDTTITNSPLLKPLRRLYMNHRIMNHMKGS